MKKLAIILQDSPIKPCGGLGIRFQKLIPFLEKNFDVTVFCSGVGGEISKTKCISLKEAPNCGYSIPLFWSEQIFESGISPDIVLCADDKTIIPAKNLARAKTAKLVVEFDLAYYGYSTMFRNREAVEGSKQYGPLTEVIQFVENIGIEAADLIITCSEYYKKVLPKGKEKAVAVQNGINIDEWTGDGRYTFRGGFKNNLVFIGRLNTQKGISLLTEHIRTLRDGKFMTLEQSPDQYAKIPEDTALHFIGDSVASDQYDAVIQTCKSHSRKFYVPWISGAEKANAMRSANAILFPSKHEPFGIVGLEAFAAGTPLITTGQGGISDYANSNNSIICDPTPDGIEAAIRRVLSMNETLKEALMENAFETALQFSWGRMANKMISALESL